MLAAAAQALHGVVATVTATPELELTDEEAMGLSTPAVLLMDHYSVTPPPEVILWSNMFAALGLIYGPRVALIRMRKAEERAKNAKPVPPSTREPGTVRPRADDRPMNGRDAGVQHLPPGVTATPGGFSGGAPFDGGMN